MKKKTCFLLFLHDSHGENLEENAWINQPRKVWYKRDRFLSNFPLLPLGKEQERESTCGIALGTAFYDAAAA